MRALKLVVFGDGQALENELPRSAYREIGAGEILALGAFEFPDLGTGNGLRAHWRSLRRRREFEMSVRGYCLRILEETNPPVLLVVIDAVSAPRDRRAFKSAHVIASGCLAAAAMRTGTDTTVLAVVMRSSEDLRSLARHIDRGHFDPLRVGGLTVIDAQRLRRELPSEIQAAELS